MLGCTGIVLSLGIPIFNRFHQEWSLWIATQLLKTSLLWGRGHAVYSGSALMFEIDPDGKSYHWTDPASGEKYINTVRQLPGSTRIIGAPGRPLRFYPHGNAAPAGTYRINNECGTYRVIVNLAGRIRIQRE